MNFELSAEQGMLRDTLAQWLADHYDFEKRRAVTQSAAGWRPEVWQAFAKDLGILGAALPEALDGEGGGAIENALIMEELGKSLVLEPYLSTVVIGGGLLARAGGALAREFVPRIVRGEVVLAFAMAEHESRHTLHDFRTTATRRGRDYVVRGRKAVVVGAGWATHLVVVAREGEGVTLLLVDRKARGVSVNEYPTVDGGRAANVIFDDVTVPAERVIGEPGRGAELLDRIVDEALCALGAESVGCMSRMHADTVEYIVQRKQFGMPLAGFQVLQHKAADMFVALEQTRALVQVAALKLDTPERARAASAAKVQCATAGKFIGQSAIQLHGGMGITEELRLGHYFRRLTAIAAQFGSTDFHLRRYADLALANAGAKA